ncbi:tRNA1(Val) (adenine(37)-N6)-methyltransferase [Salibacterium salarium]|uniref:tRNA1(Val) (adenine(37)-N6)-methyltransferase n=1 Tax=Salibacterium salarium TaxID=284579 RepID=UPI0027D81B66|nr:tRNA1(Val) (adenine(37)-N6)-methyltransferase [Salibacterium salarium]
MTTLFEGERFDFISSGLHIIQSQHVFSFTIDAVLLARFAYVPITKGSIIDLCSGNGVIPLVLSTRSEVSMTGVEIQSKLVDMARRSAQYNQLQTQLSFIEADVREKKLVNKTGEADLVTCNPPYFATAMDKDQNTNPSFTAARHEKYGTLDDIIQAASKLVKQKGKLAMVHRPERLPELIETFRKYRIEPKRMKCIFPKADKDANILLIEGIKEGKPGMTCLPPLTVYSENGTYTEEFKTYYEGT